MKQLKSIAPDYPRIPHLSSEISRLGTDDFVEEAIFPLSGWVQEKVDAANMGVSWDETAILRNRNHILKKGYSKIRTPAKEQFKSAWNWVHAHEDDINRIESEWGCKVTIYGEWMFAKHSLDYDNIPDWFLAYDIWSVEDKKFISPSNVKSLLEKTSIHFIESNEIVFNNLSDVKNKSNEMSSYRNGKREGIVIKTVKGNFIDKFYKIVNDFFERREDFNESLLTRNKLKK
jgi:hypothetical protein